MKILGQTRPPEAAGRAALGGGTCTANVPIPTITDGHQILGQAQPQYQDHFSKLGLSQIPAGSGRKLARKPTRRRRGFAVGSPPSGNAWGRGWWRWNRGDLGIKTQ